MLVSYQRKLNCIEKTGNQVELQEFLLDAIPFLNAYHGLKSDDRSREQLTCEFQKAFNCQEGIRSKQVFADQPSNSCTECKTSNSLILDSRNAIIVCTECGIQSEYSIPDGKASLPHADRITLPSSVYTYKPLSHFADLLRNVEARNTRIVPLSAFESIKHQFEQLRVSPERITPHFVKEIMRELRLCKYYENVQQITHRLNPQYKLVRIPEKRILILKSMFREVYPRFFRNAKKVDRCRKNFLSYPYCAYKFSELCGWEEYLPLFPLLKSREKLRAQDAILRLIFDELGWTWFDTV